MKASLCILLMAAVAVSCVEEKKTEKRGVLGLGYGGYGGYGLGAPLVSHGYYGHGLGLYNHGIGGYYGHGLAAPLVGGYGHGLVGGYGHGLAAPLVGGYGHGLAAAPLLSHSVSYGSPLLGLGHGWH